jgi:hypothetical protein
MKRNVMSIRGALSKLEEIIIYFSNYRKKFSFSAWLTKTLDLWPNEILYLKTVELWITLTLRNAHVSLK